MYRLLILLLSVVLFPLSVKAQKTKTQRHRHTTCADVTPVGAHLRFEENTFDFGDVPRKGGNLTKEFVFINDGTEPLVILRALTSCSCTKVSFSKRPIAPGERGVIKVVYELHKKEPGTFSKVIQIFSTSVDGRSILTVRGNSIDTKKL